jgi:hypothetical protein
MIVRHSKKILEQLSEIEGLISKIESYMDENGIDVDREMLLLRVLKEREASLTPRNKKEN